MIDLHMHTNFSDGEISVIDLLKKCEDLGIKIISITDHNTLKPYEELDRINVSDYFSGTIINGVELDTVVYGKAFEFLVYDFDMDKLKPWIEEKYKTKPERQALVYEELVRICKELGIELEDIEWDPSKEYVHSVIFRMFKACENNKDNELIKQFDNYRDFYRISSTDKTHPLYVDFSIVYATLEELIEQAHLAGGKIFLAHLFEYKLDNYEEFLDKLIKDYNIDGIEICHSKFNKDQSGWLYDYCKKNNLKMSAGSDYHGKESRDEELGTNFDEDLIKDWYTKI